MEPEIFEALEALKEKAKETFDSKAVVEEILRLLKNYAIKKVVDIISDKLRLEKEEIEPVVVQLAAVSLGPLEGSTSIQVVDADGTIVDP